MTAMDTGIADSEIMANTPGYRKEKFRFTILTCLSDSQGQKDRGAGK